MEAPQKTKEECIKACEDMIEQGEFDLKKAKSPSRIRVIKTSLSFWKSMQYYLTNADTNEKKE